MHRRFDNLHCFLVRVLHNVARCPHEQFDGNFNAISLNMLNGCPSHVYIYVYNWSLIVLLLHGVFIYSIFHLSNSNKPRSFDHTIQHLIMHTSMAPNPPCWNSVVRPHSDDCTCLKFMFGNRTLKWQFGSRLVRPAGRPISIEWKFIFTYKYNLINDGVCKSDKLQQMNI